MDGTETTLDKAHCATITKLDQNHVDIIYLIILHHYINKVDKNSEKGSEKYNLPYGARTIADGKGITFRRLNLIPDDVQKIICRYLTMISN